MYEMHGPKLNHYFLQKDLHWWIGSNQIAVLGKLHFVSPYLSIIRRQYQHHHHYFQIFSKICSLIIQQICIQEPDFLERPKFPFHSNKVSTVCSCNTSDYKSWYTHLLFCNQKHFSYKSRIFVMEMWTVCNCIILTIKTQSSKVGYCWLSFDPNYCVLAAASSSH